jgi:hypothetical protein
MVTYLECIDIDLGKIANVFHTKDIEVAMPLLPLSSYTFGLTIY